MSWTEKRTLLEGVCGEGVSIRVLFALGLHQNLVVNAGAIMLLLLDNVEAGVLESRLIGDNLLDGVLVEAIVLLRVSSDL